ncbi:hypothetical protein [[Mycobacterium] nativiensis]|uniref:Uncharacterized protein n=1 Tax=[Mycobacterium] nativiensis TaxID=2855503 RepID=A0ABU5XWG6_9MYCO|nr:hypothetical protein [Mycolicibacter sp. MYC340]MEB3032334.1 hypothetical protein [Mycolicibacter sp. MYC340]
MRSTAGRLLLLGMAALLVGPGVGGCVTDSDLAGYHLVVRQDGRVLDTFDLPRLRDLPQIEIATPQSRGNQVQRGPELRSVLTAAGAADVNRIRVQGSDPAQTLTAAELADRVVLSFTKRDTVKLAGVDLDRERWVRDVTEVVVNP